MPGSNPNRSDDAEVGASGRGVGGPMIAPPKPPDPPLSCDPPGPPTATCPGSDGVGVGAVGGALGALVDSGAGVSPAVGRAVGTGVGLGVGRGVGFGVGFGVGLGVGFGVGFGVGATMTTCVGETFFRTAERLPAPVPLVASKR